jgi:prophage tail gpP-like protein
MADLVTLRTGGAIHSGWKRVSITASLERVSGSWEFEASESWTEQGRLVTRQLAAGQACEVAIDGEVVVTGWVDAAALAYSSSSKSVKVRGRDRTADLVDCSATAKEFAGQRLLAIATELCRPFGVAVRLVGWGGGAVIPKYSVDPGETVIRALEDACRQLGVMMWTDGLGALLIGRPVAGALVGTLKLGVNILEAEGGDDWTERFSEITVQGATNAGDDDEAHAASGTARDAAITRYRPLVMVAETAPAGGPTCAERAAWEARVRRARALKTSLKVQGWRAPSGALWRPGQTVEIDDDWLGRHRTLVVSEVAFSAGISEGIVTRLTLMPADALSRLAEGIDGADDEDDE